MFLVTIGELGASVCMGGIEVGEGGSGCGTGNVQEVADEVLGPGVRAGCGVIVQCFPNCFSTNSLYS